MVKRVKLRQRAKFRGDRSNHRRQDIVIFRLFKMAVAAIMDFFEIFNGRTAQKGSNCVTVPNFVDIAQTAAEIWRFFDFSKMAAVRHLEFVCVFGPPTKGIWWSLSLCKIWLESMQ